MSETKARLYNRCTVTKKLDELLDRVNKLNNELEHPEFAYYVEQLIIFGSYVNTDNDKIHDLDVGIKLGLKSRYNNNVRLAMKEALKRAPYSCDTLTSLYWAQEEVLRYLKNKSGIYSFHPMNSKGEVDIIMSAHYNVLVDNGVIIR